MIIRTATVDDLPYISEIDKEAIAPSWSDESFLNEINNEYSCFQLAEFDNHIVGFCLLKLLGDEAELLRIAVEKSYRRNNVADRLLFSMLDYTSVNKIKTIFLEVRHSNIAAINLYNKHGFTKIGTRIDYYTEPTEDAIIMRYRIRNSEYGIRS